MSSTSESAPLGKAHATGLARGLGSRQIRLIALGSAIGVGLFLGSAQAISNAGPALLLAYALAGATVFLVARALGEMLLYRPITGSIATYAEEFLGPWAGFVTGWSFWLMYLVVGVAEITAVGIYVRYWYPDLPQWIPALVTLATLTAANLLAVQVFGEVEFWFALIKVVTVIALILFGAAALLFGFGGELGHSAALSNLWAQGGFLPHGLVGLALTLPIATFAFGGVELIGIAAGEARDPERTLPRAINGVLYRILLFYIGAMAAIMVLVPWNALAPTASPFVLVFDRFGIPAAATVVNFVVITAAASACNSGLFSTGRMLHTLAHAGHAPRAFARLSRQSVPAVAVAGSACLMLGGVLLNYLAPERVFLYVLSVALSVQLWVWGVIVAAHLGYRRAVRCGTARPSPYRMPGAPATNVFALGFLVLVAVLLAFDAQTRVALYVAPVWFALVGAGFMVLRRRSLA
ncbi:MAG: amino acid permease [Acetobacteraceae bacterium]|nr:amino acid permease [Acetobacteraceae bacterium]